MTNAPVTRKLAAILSADVQGYSRLMGDDEMATIRTLRTYREVMTSLIEQHHGRVVDSPGDNLLAEFASAVDGVEGAVAIQQELKTRNAQLPPDRQMHYRIGINVGDVVVEGERIYGDGVNLAARLESLAEGGGIAISEAVHTQVKNKLSFGFAYQGEQSVKNIVDPVRVYAVQLDANRTPAIPSPPVSSASRRWSIVPLNAVVVLLLGLSILVWQQTARDEGVPAGAVQGQDTSGLRLPDKASIAVLPFTNMSGDLEQEYFSDGMTDDIITDLSKISGLFVIARNSTFTYKGQAVDVGEVGRKLGVRYLLEGSVRKAGNRLRIHVQLIDAVTGGHVLAERYDRELADIFMLQDEVTQHIVAALHITLTGGEQKQLNHQATENLVAYDYYLQGREAFYHYTQDMNLHARPMFERALAVDPQYAAAYATLGFTYWVDYAWQWTSMPRQTLDRMSTLAQQAISYDDTLPLADQLLGYRYLYQGQYAQAVAAAERAVALDTNNAENYARLGTVFHFSGQYEKAIHTVHHAMRLNPHYPVYYLFTLGAASYVLRRFEDAQATLLRANSLNPDYLFSHILLVAVHSEEGRQEAAQTEIREVLRINPQYLLEAYRLVQPYKDATVTDRIVGALRQAGLE